MSSEWVDKGELSAREIQIHAPSLLIRCKIQGNCVDMLYNPTVGANRMSNSFALTSLGKEPRTPTVKSFRVTPQSSLKGLHHGNVKMALNFHIFDILDFDILIGHPPRKTLLGPTKNRGYRHKVGERRLYHSYHLSQKLGGRISPPSRPAQGGHVGSTP